jgi:uncharacterized protein YdbL (DUF1318 family)
MTRRIFLVLLLALLPAFVASPAFADALDTAKAAGQVGERPDGLLGIVGSPTAQLNALVKDVNDRRMTLFRRIASEKGQSLAAVQAVSGQEFIARTPAGQYVMNASGNWVKK